MRGMAPPFMPQCATCPNQPVMAQAQRMYYQAPMNAGACGSCGTCGNSGMCGASYAEPGCAYAGEAGCGGPAMVGYGGDFGSCGACGLCGSCGTFEACGSRGWVGGGWQTFDRRAPPAEGPTHPRNSHTTSTN